MKTYTCGHLLRVMVGIVTVLVGLTCLTPAHSQDGGTFLPSGELAAITAKNLDQLTWVGRLGQGTQTPSVTWLPDNQHFVLPGSMGVWLYDLNNPQAAPRLFESPESEITCLTISPDGRWIAAGRQDSSIAIWDMTADTNFVFTTLVNVSPKPTYLVAFNPDMTTLTSVNLYENVTLWDISKGLDQGHIKNVIPYGDERFYSLSPDGLQFFTLYDEWNNNQHVTILRRRSLIGEENLWEFVIDPPQISYLEQVLFSPNDELMATVYSKRDQGDLIQLWDNRANEPVMIGEPISVYGERRYIEQILFTPDGQQLVTVSDGFFGYRTHVRDVSHIFTDGPTSVMEVANVLHHGISYRFMRFSPDGKRLAVNTQYQPDYHEQLEIWDWPSREVVWEQPTDNHSTVGNRVSFSANGQTLLTWGVSYQSTLHLFDFESGTELLSSDNGIMSAVHPSNAFFLGDASLWQINATDHTLNRVVNLHYANWPNVAFSFSADGNRFVTFSAQRYNRNLKIQLWDFVTQQLITEYEYDKLYATLKSLTLSPDAKTLAVAYEIYNAPQTIDLLDATTGRIMLSFSTEGTPESLFFNPTGEILGVMQSTTNGYAVTLWDVKNSLLAGEGLSINAIYLPTPENGYWALPQVAFSSDGNLLAINNPAGGISFWETAALSNSSRNPMPIFTLPTYNRVMDGLTFSPDSKWIASLSGGYGAVWLWGIPMEK